MSLRRSTVGIVRLIVINDFDLFACPPPSTPQLS